MAARRGRRAGFLLVWLALVLGAAESVESPVQLLLRMQQALGGGDKLAAIVDIDQRVRAVIWDDRARYLGRVVKRVRWVKPRYLRIDQVGPGDTYVLYFDGTSGWEILPGGRAAIDLIGGELRLAQKSLRDFPLKAWLANRDPRYVVTSPAPNVVRVADQANPDDSAHQIDFTLDPLSARPIKERTLSLANPGRPVWGETRITEWERVEGLQFPRRYEVFLNGARLADITLEYVRLNSGLSAADLATRPRDLTPAIGR
jgi:hypothetical protein